MTVDTVFIANLTIEQAPGTALQRPPVYDKKLPPNPLENESILSGLPPSLRLSPPRLRCCIFFFVSPPDVVSAIYGRVWPFRRTTTSCLGRRATPPFELPDAWYHLLGYRH